MENVDMEFKTFEYPVLRKFADERLEEAHKVAMQRLAALKRQGWDVVSITPGEWITSGTSGAITHTGTTITYMHALLSRTLPSR